MQSVHDPKRDLNVENRHEEDSSSDEMAPNVGMVFNSEEEVYDLFNKYAEHNGFGIVRKSTKKDDDGKLKYYSLMCAKSGNSVSISNNSFKPRRSTKTACKAKINVSVTFDGKFAISRANLVHNHELSPMSCFFKRSKKRRVEVNDKAGKPLSKKFHSLVVEVGQYGNLPLTEERRNCSAKERRFILRVGDAEALLTYFLRMQKRNSNFFYVIDMDEEGQMRNAFWSDAVYIAAYESLFKRK